MSDVHIRDLNVRPESLCGYTGPPGTGKPTCADCIAVDEHLVVESSGWERFCDRVLVPLLAVTVLVMAYGAFFGPRVLAIVAGGVGGGFIVIAVPVGFLVERRRSGHLKGEVSAP